MVLLSSDILFPRTEFVKYAGQGEPLPMLKPTVKLEDLKRRVREVLPEITEIRHALHRIPETKLEEKETAKRIRDVIAGTGVEVLEPYLGTDVVALLWGTEGGGGRSDAGQSGQPKSGRREQSARRAAGKGGGLNVTLRADIDALPIEDKSGKAWASGHTGRAHACGHDGHTAILLGTLKVLAGLTDRFSGSVRFVFQPAEEEAAGGKMMIDKGLLATDPRPAAVFALHGWPGTPVGTVAATPGAAMAAQDRFRITVSGRGGHGAVPHRSIDPIVTSAQVIMGLQTVISRSLDPVSAAVCSVCTIHGGQASNAIPDEVVMEGTTRYFDRKVQSVIRSRMEEVIGGICSSASASYSFRYDQGYIPLVNDPQEVSFLARVVEAYLGRDAWIADLPPTMGAEDFAYYLDRVPGVFLRLGLGEKSPSLHSPEFDFNDRALEPGITVMSALALETLARGAAGSIPEARKSGSKQKA